MFKIFLLSKWCLIATMIYLASQVYAQRNYGLTSATTRRYQSNSQATLRSQAGQQQVGLKSASCPEPNIRLQLSECNKYIECLNGTATEKTCPDGLFYKVNASFFTDPCAYPIDVDCGSRSKPASKSQSKLCPYENGYFRVSPEECDKFIICSHGTAHTFSCPAGLVFDTKTYICEWPDNVDDCDVTRLLGFSCPQVGDIRTLKSDYQYYAHPEDNKKYFICIGNAPRLLTCADNKIFNTDKNECESVNGEFDVRALGSTNKSPETGSRSDSFQQGGQRYQPQSKQLTTGIKSGRRYRRLVRKLNPFNSALKTI